MTIEERQELTRQCPHSPIWLVWEGNITSSNGLRAALRAVTTKEELALLYLDYLKREIEDHGKITRPWIEKSEANHLYGGEMFEAAMRDGVTSKQEM